MPKKKHRRYSPEFKRHALKRASEDGVVLVSKHSRTIEKGWFWPILLPGKP